MTPKEALYWCEQFEDNIVLADPQKQKMVLALQAMKECKKALEKQIPKKPVESIHKYIDSVTKKHGGYRLTHCPRCWDNKQLGYFSTLVDKYTLYCHRCGQALDWSDAE